MVSENEIQQQIDSYLKDENLELYDLNIVNFPNISKIEVFIYSVEDVNIDITTRLNRQLNRLVEELGFEKGSFDMICLLYTSPSPRDSSPSRMPSSA